MHAPRFAVLAVVLPLLATGCAASFVSSPPASRSGVRPEMLGAWELVTPEYETHVREVKLITPRRFHWTTWNADTHEIIATGGGTYTASGRSYVERLDYAQGAGEELIGQRLPFEVVVRGDMLLQRGTPDSPLSELREVWRRVK